MGRLAHSKHLQCFCRLTCKQTCDEEHMISQAHPHIEMRITCTC